MTKRSERWEPVAEAVRARMTELGMHRKADLYRAADLSEPTVRPLITAELRGGQEPTEATCRTVSTALGWTSESIALILRGKPPVVAPVGASAPAGADPATRLDAVEAGVRELRRSLLELTARANPRIETFDELLEVVLPAIDARVAALEDRDRGQASG